MSESARTAVQRCRTLVVGAGGIGCELLKNLVLGGFKDIEVVDLDTIDVSNLNRQFLFRKQHVGLSKAKVAKESAQRLNRSARIVAHHDSITSHRFGVPFYKNFSVVMNALDNRTARNHVNRMCLAADIPLIESGTAGYLGQVSVIKKGVTECYECQPRGAEKTYPGCTIRNTPSEPIHCIVWAKHLFNQLFGEADPDEDVSPDTSDPNAAGESGTNALNSEITEDGNVERLSTRAWAVSCGYNPSRLFKKLFHDDIKYLLSMDKLWQKRKAPVPLVWASLPDAVASSSKTNSETRDQRLWSVLECASIFEQSVKKLKEEMESLKEGEHLQWDKDDNINMDFVASCANIRAHIFGIPQKNCFDIKSMAGNIIPAIATTNAVIAGLIVMEALKILQGRLADCKAIYLNKHPHPKTRHLLAPCPLVKPNASCLVCSEKPEVSVKLNTKSFTVKMLEEKVLKSQLNMIAPDVEIDDGKGTILISSEEGETEENGDKFLSCFHIEDGSRLKCDDFLQNYTLIVNISHCDQMEDDREYEVVGSASPEAMKEEISNSRSTTNGHTKFLSDDDDDDLIMVEPEDLTTKRTHDASSGEDEGPSFKRMKKDDDDDSDVELIFT